MLLISVKKRRQANAFLIALFLAAVFIWTHDDKEELQHLAAIATKETKGTSGFVYQISKIRIAPPNQLRYQSKVAVSKIQNSQWPTDEFWNRRGCKNWGALATISPPSEAIQHFGTLHGWCLVVTADRKGPDSYEIPSAKNNVIFLSRERQKELEGYFEFVKRLPWNHVARKNIAYLYAVANGAQFIWDFDDDNKLNPNETLIRYTSSAELKTFGERHRSKVLMVNVKNNTECGVFNPYPFFGSSDPAIWPRGYPLDKINLRECELQAEYSTNEVDTDKIGVYQSIANGNPDVDGVYRLTRRLPVTFTGAVEDEPVLLPQKTMSPTNAHASLISHLGLWSLFLPTTVQGQVSDIWRSYIAQRLAKNCGMLVAFVGPHVTRERSAHKYLADMDAERQLYERSGSLVTFLLNDWEYVNKEPTLEGAWERLYADLYERGIFEWEDVELAQFWVSALSSVGYQFPKFQSTSATAKRGLPGEGHPASRLKTWRNVSAEAPAPMKEKRRTCGVENVVLLGQFNYITPAQQIKHWVERWRDVFQHVEVWGPLTKTSMATLRGSGITAFSSVEDGGWYSPMKNLANSLRLHAKDPTKCGVMLIHDDLMVNLTYLETLGFPSDNAVVAQYSSESLSKPYITVFPNKTFKVQNNENIFHFRQYEGALDEWSWWSVILSNVTKAVESSPGREFFMNADGGMDFFPHVQSDLLYVPLSLADDFATHAEWMFKNEIMLELGMPTIVARLKTRNKVYVKEALLCTEWDYNARRNALKWAGNCIKTASFGSYHPLKLAVLGTETWNSFFDKIVLGKVETNNR